MKSVLFTASSFGHIISFHLPYLKEFHDMGWRVTVACGGEAPEIPYADGVIRLPFEKKISSAGNFRAASLLRKAIRADKYDLIITHTSLAAFFTRLAVKGMADRPRLINVVHGYLFDDGTPPLKAFILKLAELLTAPQTDLLLTMNGYDLQWAKKHRAGKRIDFIPGIGLEPSRVVPRPDKRSEYRQKFGFGCEDYVFVYPAEFSSRKNQSFLIGALPELPEKIKLLLPGRGDRLDECKALAHKLGVAERVCFSGFVSDISQCLCAADAAVSSSLSEGLPLNIMEAMYAGLPVLASDVKGHTDLICNGQSGLLYTAGDANSFISAAQRLYVDPALQSGLAAAAQERIKKYLLCRVKAQVMEKYLSCRNG